MTRLRRTFLDGSAEFYLVAGKPKLRIWGETASGKLHEVLVDLGGEHTFTSVPVFAALSDEDRARALKYAAGSERRPFGDREIAIICEWPPRS